MFHQIIFLNAVKIGGDRMTREQFKKALQGSAKVGGMFEFYTDQHEGTIFSADYTTFVWVDKIGFSRSSDRAEPEYVGEYKSVDEMLSAFRVNGNLFADAVLPAIRELKQIYT